MVNPAGPVLQPDVAEDWFDGEPGAGSGPGVTVVRKTGSTWPDRPTNDPAATVFWVGDVAPATVTAPAVNGMYATDVFIASSGPAAALPAGTISMWASDVAPTNWLICDGSAVSRTQYASLFDAIGTRYGAGDGVNTFNLPNLKGRTPVGKDTTQTEFDVLGEFGGAKTHTLKAAESGLPAHVHGYQPQFFMGNGTAQQDGSAISGSYKSTLYPNQSAYGAIPPQNTNGNTAADAAQPHNNLQPYTVVHFIIKVSAGETPGDSELTQRVSALEGWMGQTPAGTVTIWGGDTAPTNWLLCDGAAVSRTTYASLFAVIGTKYGVGDGSTTFNLPNLKGRVPTGLDPTQTEFNVLGKTGGTKVHSHWHVSPIGIASGNMYVLPVDAPGLDASGGANPRYDLSFITQAMDHSVALPKQGAGAMEIYSSTSSDSGTLAPYQVVNYIIKFTNGDTQGDSQLTQRVSAIESGTAYSVSLRDKMARFQQVLTGGGVRKVDVSQGIAWTERFVVLGAGIDELVPGGYFNIDVPPNGTVIPVYGTSSATPTITVANGYIPVPDWGALYYDLPVGSASVISDPSRFKYVSYTKNLAAKIPPTWVLIAVRNLDPNSPLITWGDGRQQDYWHALGTMQGGWLQYPAFSIASWRWTQNGSIRLKGLIYGGTGTIASWGTALAPSEQAIYNQIASGGAARLDMTPDGALMMNGYYAGGNNGWVSLENIEWYPKSS